MKLSCIYLEAIRTKCLNLERRFCTFQTQLFSLNYELFWRSAATTLSFSLRAPKVNQEQPGYLIQIVLVCGGPPITNLSRTLFCVEIPVKAGVFVSHLFPSNNLIRWYHSVSILRIFYSLHWLSLINCIEVNYVKLIDVYG